MLQVIIMASLFLVRWERTQGAVCRTGTDNMTPEKGNTILILQTINLISICSIKHSHMYIWSHLYIT